MWILNIYNQNKQHNKQIYQYQHMQKKPTPASNQTVQDQISVSSLPQQVIEFFQSRIETEQNYSKALQKLNNKFPNIETQPTQSSKVLKHLKAIHSEKYHQTVQFIDELREEKNKFQEAIAKANGQLQKAANQVKICEGNLKVILEKIGKLSLKGQEEIKNLDQKFILKQLSTLCSDYKTKKIEDSLKILEQQSKVCSSLQKQYEQLKTQGQKIIKKIKKHEKTILETSPQIQKQIIELVKRYTVQQVSLIRNMQYDIDTMIKKTNIFDEQPTPSNANSQPSPPPKSKNIIVKNAKQIFKNQFKIKNPFEETKRTIANANEQYLKGIQLKKSQGKKQEVEELIKKWNDKKNSQEIMGKLNENYQENKQIYEEFVESFRNKNICKFSGKEFQQLQKIFAVFFSKSIQNKDFFNIQKLITYASFYSCMDKQKGSTNTIMDSLSKNKNQLLSNPYFWKFLLYFVIQKSVIQCKNIQNEKDIHLKNNVFSALVSNSLNMIGCGIDKYVTKNTVAKIAKCFGLSDIQIGDLLKFIQSGYEKYQKQKNKK